METEKIKTVEEQIFDLKFKGEEFNPNAFNDWAKENELEAYNLCLKVAKRLVKQPPVSVIPSDNETKKLLKELIELAEDGHKLHQSNGVHQEFLSENKAVLRQANELLLSLSKEAPKEQDKENEFTAFDQIRSETPKGIDDMVDKAMREADERETAIEFANWIEKSSGYYPIYTPGTKFNGSWDAKDGTESDGKIITTDQLFDLFKQRNK